MTPLRTGLIGSPLKRSLSPLLFRIFNRLLAKNFSYALLEASSTEELVSALETMKAGGWAGFNVTIPLKEKIVPFLGRLSPDAKAIGAVNAVTIRNGRLKGFNTDAFALELALKEAGCRVRGRICVIWGAGGAARAAAWTLARGGAAEIRVLNRGRKRAERLAAHFRRIFPAVRFTAGGMRGDKRGASVFVNATPLGMYEPLPPALDFDGTPGSCYIDLAYNSTAKKSARAGGRRTFLDGRAGTAIPGLDLLIYQALKSAELFGGPKLSRADAASLKEKVRKAIRRTTDAA